MMNILQKIVGDSGCLLITGDTKAVLPTGYAAYAVIIRIDDTAIDEVEQIVSGVPAVLDDASWMGVALTRGEYIPFLKSVTSITMTNAADSVFCYLEPCEWVEPITSFSATLDSEVAIDLDWTNNTNTDGVRIERSLDGINFTEIIVIPNQTPAIITYKDEDLEEETKYYYRARAYYQENYSTFTAIDDATTETIE